MRGLLRFCVEMLSLLYESKDIASRASTTGRARSLPAEVVRLRLVAGAAIAAALLGIATPPSAAAAGISPPAATQVACPFDQQRADLVVTCHVLAVPEDWEQPGEGSIALTFARARPVRPHPPASPVLHVASGPGASLVGSGWAQSLLSRESPAAAVIGGREWVMVEQRGAGLTAPVLACGGVALSDAAVAAAADVQALSACATLWGRAGVDLRQYRNGAVARDLDAVRAAIGAEQVDLFGESYGGSYAFAYARAHPERVRAIVMDAAVTPEANSDEDSPQWVVRGLDSLFAACAREPACAKRNPALLIRTEAFIRALARQPVKAGDRSLTDEDFANLIFYRLYDEASLSSLPDLVGKIVSGDAKAFLDALPAPPGYAQAQTLSVLCQDEIPFESPARMRAAVAGRPLGEALARRIARFWDICRAWPRGPTDPASANPLRSDVPVLFLAGAYDPCCPPEYATAAAAHLPNAQVVIFPSASHGAFGLNACASAIVERFLERPLRKVDAACVASLPQIRFRSSP